MSLKRIAPLLVVLFGFAVRVYAMDTAWIDGDRANPHGIGIVLLDAVARGDWANFPLFSDDASIGLPNPPLLTYAYAFAALTGRSLSMANALGLIANTIAVAAAYGIGRRVGGWHAGMIAATLLACSNWGVTLARGTWHPTPLEPGTVLSAFLLIAGVTRSRPRLLLAGFVVAALTAFTDVKAFVLLAQAPLAVLIAGGARGPQRRVWLQGVAICIGAGLLYVALLFAGGRADTITNIGLLRAEQPAFTEGDLRARDITPENRDPVGHFLRLATNAGYALTWTDPSLPGYALRRGLEDAQSTGLAVLAAIGVLVMLARLRRPEHRLLLVWAALPIAALAVLALRRDDFRVPPYYLLFTSPVAHVAAGLALSLVLTRVKPALTALVCIVLAIVPTWNFAAAAQTVYSAPFNGNVGFMPLRWSQRLGHLWRDQCPQMILDPHWWIISLRETSETSRRGTLRDNATSLIWAANENGGTCGLVQSGPALPNAELLPLLLDDGSVVRTYRSLPYRAPADVAPLDVNLGWTLLDHTVTPALQPGGTITVTHVWRINTLPAEPYATWYYAPFVKVRAPDGAVVADINTARALEGWTWQPGDIVISEVYVQLPADAAPGSYAVQSSLFDPNQAKNAVYFDPARPGEPILTLDRTVMVGR